MNIKTWLKGIFTQDHLESLARTALKAGGGALIAHGTLSADQWQSFSGVAVLLLGLLFSLIDSVENPAPAKTATPTTPKTP